MLWQEVINYYSLDSLFLPALCVFFLLWWPWLAARRSLKFAYFRGGVGERCLTIERQGDWRLCGRRSSTQPSNQERGHSTTELSMLPVGIFY